MFVIEDESHAELQDGRFASRVEALAELERRAAIPWNEAPNQAPCTSWRTCGRLYIIAEVDDSSTLWRQISSEAVLEVSATGARWLSSRPEK